jgi:hypothetical protein
MKRIICKRSGLRGFQERLQKMYTSFDEFKRYSEMYGLHARLGFTTPETCWKSNPIVEGSVDPGDYRRVRAKRK